jgi:metal-sulfur cluster biosynthetic enzyme
MNDADLLQALRDCYDPTLRHNIVEARLVRSASLTLDNDAPGATIPGVPPRFLAHITLTSPSSDEAVNSQLVAQIENRLLGLPAISRAEIRLLPQLFPIL